MKRQTSYRLDTVILDYINYISEMNDISQSKAVELAIGIVKDYFTDKMIRLEYEARGDIDGRKKIQV